MSIQQNIAARKTAQEAFSFALELIQENGLTPEQKDRCIAELHRMTQGPLFSCRPVDGGQPMTDSEARAFEDMVVPYGKYQGDRIADVPVDYLNWLNDQPDFRRELSRYCASERWKLVQEAEEL